MLEDNPMHISASRLGRLAAVTGLLLAATALPTLAQGDAAICPSGFAEAPQLKTMVDAGGAAGGAGGCLWRPVHR